MSTQPIDQGRAVLPASGLWAIALQDLGPEETEIISHHTKATRPAEVVQIVEEKGQEAWRKRISFKRSNGEVVFLHDIFAKVARWVKKFVEVGDIAVQYDPTHAALAWATVRFVLQASINDIQRQGFVLENVEHVTQTISLGAIYECIYLADYSVAGESLKATLTKLYTLSWSSLAKALRFYEQSKMKRVLTSLVDLESDFGSFSERIANQWTLVDRSTTLIRAESLLSQSSKSQSHNQQLLRMMEDIRMPISRIETYVEEDHQTLDEIQRDRILDTISSIPYPQHHAKVNRNVLSGTGKWLLDHSLVKKWFSSSASEILWLHGIPGSGKSCLMSMIVEKLIAESAHNPSSFPVYFYCTRNTAEKERADPTYILRSILRQLSMPRSTKALPTCMVDSFNKARASFLDLGDTLQLVMDIIKTRPITYIVLDALDECDTDLRFELTDALETILRESQSLVKIFVSSRNDLDLVCWLREYPNKEILSSDNQTDLAAFVEDEVDRRVDGRPRRLLRNRKISDALRDDIKRTLKAQAQGMFRWAELQLQYLCKLLTEEDIRQRLGALPKDLTESYHDIYHRNMSELRDIDLEYEADAKKVFHLMLSSHQPWSPIEMANILDPAPNAVLRQPEKVFGLTFHLVTHDKELDVLRFVHLSVREFFESHLPEFAPSRNVEGAVSACLDYLEKTRDFGFRPLSYPSRYWCSDVLRLSIGSITTQFADRLEQFLVRDIRTFRNWLKEMMEEDTHVSLQWMIIPVDYLISDDESAVFAACALGLEDVLFHLIKANPRCVHAKNLRGDSTLLVACQGAHTNIMSTLLQNGCAINERVGRDQNLTALGAALSVSFPSIVVIRELLENAADPNCIHGRDKASALQIAATKRDTESVELLLNYGADPNLASGRPSQTALYAAAKAEGVSCEIVMKLLEAGASVKLTDGVRNDALQVAVIAGRDDIVNALLSFDADVNALGAEEEDESMECRWKESRAKRRSPLFLAIHVGAEQMARQLLSRGANPVPRNYAERSTLEKFLRSGDAELAKLLLFAPNQDRRASTMIQAAQILGEDEIITGLDILREQEPDGREMCEAMDLAAKGDLFKVFERLVEHAYNFSLPFGFVRSALSGTARRGQAEMFKILWMSLLRTRSTRSSGDDSSHEEVGGSNASLVSLHTTMPGCGQRAHFSFLLHEAAAGGATDIFQFILAEGADITAKRIATPDGSPKNASTLHADSIRENLKPESATSEIQSHGPWYLRAAVEAGQVDMVDLLLRLGADANATGPYCDDQNALCTALILRKDPSIVKSLLIGGVDVNVRMVYGFGSASYRAQRYGTALTMAMLGTNSFEETSATVIELLLEYGADANASDDEYGSILQLAVAQRHIRAIELLLAHRADVNKGGGKHGSPLIAAIACANEKGTGTRFIEILLRNGADPNMEHGGDSGTALRAALSEHLGSFGMQILQLLLTHGANLSAIGPDGSQALHVTCAHYGHAAEFLLSQGADVNAKGGPYGNALQAACARAGYATSMPTLVELLIAKGAEVNARGGRFGSPLQAACIAGPTRTVEILLANGADVHVNDGEYGYALQAAARAQNPLPKMKLLLSYGADINACGGLFGTALQAACVCVGGLCKESVVNFLLDRGADVNRRGGKYGFPLICAAVEAWLSNSKTKFVNLLLDRGSDINCCHETHGNALYAACQTSCTPVMELLIKRGISLTQQAGEHEHALFVACLKNQYGNMDAKRVNFLLDKGVDVHILGRRYRCALEVAIRAQNFEAAELLINRGADVHVKTKEDASLLDIAKRLSSTAMVELLLANGA